MVATVRKVTAQEDGQASSNDVRHQRRIEVVENLFAYSFIQPSFKAPHKSDLFESIIPKIPEIDVKIVEFAPKFPIDRLSKIDLAILRLAIYELMVSPSEPIKVVINEAIELAKELGGEKSYTFINGVLGKLIPHDTTK
ncbi:MAG: transcription antitermination factor NusB [Candidatus Roizmanbacteria bacterium]|nr:transcription antitermination factor NusB [Candidatus Roizmanbacteria bacterium]